MPDAIVGHSTKHAYIDKNQFLVMQTPNVLKILYHLLQQGLRLCLGQLYVKRGEKRVSYYALGKEFLYRLRTNDMIEHAYGVAFNFTLAIFPATIALFTLIPYIPIPELDQKIIAFLQNMLPLGTYEVLASTVEDTISTQRRGLLSLGFVSMLYLATNGMMSLIKTFELFQKTTRASPRDYLKRRSIALLLTLVLTLVLFSAIVLLIVGNQLLRYMISQRLIASSFQLYLILGLRLGSVALLLFMAIACIYYMAPSVQWPFFSFGAFSATFLSLLASFGFSYYVNNFAHYNRLYGSIGIFIALMIWLLLVAFILLVGFELNASIDEVARKTKAPKSSSFVQQRSIL